MSGSQPIVITKGLTPHDISTLILVVLYCTDTEGFSSRTLFKVIPPISAVSKDEAMFQLSKDADTNLLLKPILLELIEFLLKNDAEKAALRLLAALDSITNLNGISRLIRILDTHSLINTYREITERTNQRVFKRQLTRKSVFGAFVNRCVSKYKVEDFQDSEMLWSNFLAYTRLFKKSSLWESLSKKIPPLDPVMSFIFENKHYSDDLESFKEFDEAGLFKRYSEVLLTNEKLLMVFSKEHFQSLLNSEVEQIIHSNGKMSRSTREILRGMSLEDKTRFPTVYVLDYLESISRHEYDRSLDSLYRYYDYVLSQNNDHYYHMSLLSLATFHGHYNNGEAAVKTFEEAISVARENKDMATLNLILVWVFGFIKQHPDLSHKFHVTTEQIINYLKSCSDAESSVVFENAYKFESLWTMLNGGSVPAVLESSFKSFVIALQSSSFQSQFESIFEHSAKMWFDLGFTFLGSTYLKLVQESGTLQETPNKDQQPRNSFENLLLESNQYDYISKGFEALCDHSYGTVQRTLLKLNSPLLSYNEKRCLELLDIRYRKALLDYDEAIKLSASKIKECQVRYKDSKWEFRFAKERCKIMIESGTEARCLSMVMDMLETANQIKDPFVSAQTAVLFCDVLCCLGRYHEAIDILESNIHCILQFSDVELQHDFFTVYSSAYSSKAQDSNDEADLKKANSLLKLKANY